MKKKYDAPMLEIEIYELDADIAQNCGIVVNDGPAVEGIRDEPCSLYFNPFSMGDSVQAKYNVNYYNDTVCDCYTTGSGSHYWTS